MIRGISLIAFTLLLLTSGSAQEKTTDATAQTGGETLTMKGYVVDQMCATGFLKKENFMEKAKAHSQDCALEDDCAETGFGIFSDGKWYRFDDGGSRKAKKLIEDSKRERGLYFEVTGTLHGDTFVVSSLKESSPDDK